MARPTKYLRLFTEEENLALKFLFPIASRKLLEFVFQIPYVNLSRKANYLGIHRKFKPNSKGDMWKLLQDTPETYYWIGFLLADGAFVKSRISLALAAEDKEHVKKFADFLGLTHLCETKSNTRTPSYNKIENPKWRYGYRVSCRNCYFVPLIKEKFNIVERKTYNCPDLEIYRNMPFELFLSLVIGYIDGDGCIQTVKWHKRSALIKINVHKNWYPFLELIQERLTENLGYFCSKPKIFSDSMVRSHIGKMEILAYMKKHILKNNLPALARKWDKINENVLRRTKKKRPTLSSELLEPAKLDSLSLDLNHNF